MNPHSREEIFIVEEISDETLVYDEDSYRAHYLNPTAAFVWRHCDGQTSIGELAKLLHDEFGIPANEKVVWLALKQLSKANLLRERMKRGDLPQYSRHTAECNGLLSMPLKSAPYPHPGPENTINTSVSTRI